jgi:O-antigen/teichoic acid export membrane protein
MKLRIRSSGAQSPVATPVTPDDTGVELIKVEDAKRRGSLYSAALFTYGTNLIVSLSSLVNVLVMSRVLGPHGRGEVAFLITVAMMTGQIAGLSIQEANANLGGSDPALRSRLATNSLCLSIACGIVAAGLVEFLTLLVPAVGGPVPTSLFWVALAAVPVVIAKNYFSFLAQAEYAFAVTNLAWLAGPVTSVTFSILLASFGMLTVTTGIATWVAGQTLGVIILLAYNLRSSGFARPDLGLARQALSFGLKTHLGRLMGLGNYRADQWFVGSISGSKELGLYSVAAAWSDMLFYLPGVITLVQRPDLVRATREDAAKRTARVFRITLLLAGVLTVVLILIAPVLCSVIFGSAFSGSTNQLRVLALGALGISALDLLPNALTAQRMPIRGMWAIAVAFVVTLALDIVLIPPMGGLGAALATALAYTFGGIAAAVIFVRTFRRPLADLIPRLGELPWLWQKLRTRFARA